MKDKRKKIVIRISLILVLLLIVIIRASYAYFNVTSTNSFGSKTARGTFPSMGGVQLVPDTNSISLNVNGISIMKGNMNCLLSNDKSVKYRVTPLENSSEKYLLNKIDVIYFGSTDGTPLEVESASLIRLAHTNVTGDEVYNCNYTLNASVSGTNNLYSVFQRWASKTSNQIMLHFDTNPRNTATCYANYCSNYREYDFNTSNLFPINVTGTIIGARRLGDKGIYGNISFTGLCNLEQNILADKEITISLSVPTFNCSIASDRYYYIYDPTNVSNERISNPLTSSSGLTYYYKGYTSGSYDEVCGQWNGVEYCIPPNNWNNASSYYSEMRTMGLSCNSTYQSDGYLECHKNSISLNLSETGNVYVENTNTYNRCELASNGFANCS